MYTAYCEAAQCSPLSRFSKTISSSSQLSTLANDDVTLVSGLGILPLRFETANAPVAPSTPAYPAKATAEEPHTPIQASRYCRAQSCEATLCSPPSHRSKAPSRRLPPLVNGDVVPVPGSYIAPLRSEVIEVLAVQAAPTTPVHQVRARAKEPRAPTQVCVRISTSSFSQANSIAGLSQRVYCL